MINYSSTFKIVIIRLHIIFMCTPPKKYKRMSKSQFSNPLHLHSLFINKPVALRHGKQENYNVVID